MEGGIFSTQNGVQIVAHPTTGGTIDSSKPLIRGLGRRLPGQRQQSLQDVGRNYRPKLAAADTYFPTAHPTVQIPSYRVTSVAGCGRIQVRQSSTFRERDSLRADINGQCR
jgi:hypothetical protein